MNNLQTNIFRIIYLNTQFQWDMENVDDGSYSRRKK